MAICILFGKQTMKCIKKTNGVTRTNVINKIINDSNLTLKSSLDNHNKIVKKVTKKINPGLKGRKKIFKN